MLLSAEQGKDVILDKVLINKNPGKTFSDSIPVKVRVWWKLFIGGDHHTIIPATINHTTWILGVQPDEKFLRRLHAEIRSTMGDISLYVVNMLHEDERLIKDQDKEKLQKEGILYEMDRRPWLDHGTVDVTTGKNQTVVGMINFQHHLYDVFNTVPRKTAFYCHCMAGKSRSFVETMAFLFFYPNKELLFDFQNWPAEMRAKITQELQDHLRNHPSFSDLAELVKIQRPDVKHIWNMDGDQAGFLGLMSLEKWANPNEADNIVAREKDRLYKDAQNVGLILKAPLDLGFRDAADRKRQEDNLAVICGIYQKQKINLLMAMIVPIKDNVDPLVYQNVEDFDRCFKKLNHNEQARFAILLKNLEEHQPILDLGPLRGKSFEYARIAAKNVRKLTAGDHIELLKNFDLAVPGSYEAITNKILNGNRYDRYNSEIQLTELSTFVKR